MKKILCAMLLIAVSLRAQTNPSSQATAPAGPEVAPQAPPSQPQPPAPPQYLTNRRIYEEARKRLQDLGYFNAGQPQAAPVKPTIPCAIPLQRIPIPDSGGVTIETTPANPSMDPKIVRTPPLPACVKSASPSVTPPQAPDKK
jgi:hypothetical protein